MCKCEDSGFFRFFPLLFCLDVMSCWLSSSFFVCRSSWWMLLKMALRKAQAKGWWRWRQKAGGLKSCWREERGRGHTVCNEREGERKKTSVRTLISGKSVLNRGSKEESFSLFFEFKIVGGVLALGTEKINSCLLLGSGLKECSCRESCWQYQEVVHKLSLTEYFRFYFFF